LHKWQWTTTEPREPLLLSNHVLDIANILLLVSLHLHVLFTVLSYSFVIFHLSIERDCGESRERKWKDFG